MTMVGQNAPQTPLNIDADPQNADWPKRTWDLPDITTLAELRAYLAAQGMTPTQFMRLPIYRANVKKMPWLRGLRTAQ